MVTEKRYLKSHKVPFVTHDHERTEELTETDEDEVTVRGPD